MHWRVPTCMGLGFFGGVILMGGHHTLYQYMDGRAANDPSVQLWIIRAGTALSFLSKLFLAIGTGIAYEQWVWVDLHSKPHDMGSLDAIFAILSNAFEFLCLRLWLRRPALTFLAVVTWCLPIAAIITPGTLSVQPVSVANATTIDILQRSYTTDSKAYCGTITEGGSTSYVGMTTSLLNPTFATVLASDILPVESSRSNLTYDLSFYGPAVSCQNSTANELEFAARAISEYENTTDSRTFYYGWVPQPGWGPEVNGSFFASSDVQIGSVRLDMESIDTARVFIYLNTAGIDQKGKKVPSGDSPSAQLITCALYNASYATTFELKSNGEQHLITSTVYQNWIPALSTLEGAMTDPSVSRQMNMQAVMEAFSMMVLGPVDIPNDDNVPMTNSVYALSMSKTMWPNAPGLNTSQVAENYMRLAESLFHNITLSMRYGIIGGEAGEDRTTTDALSETYQPQFVYEPRTLIIAYSVTTLFAFVCMLMGVHALVRNGAAYTNSFSTIVRVTRDPTLNRLITDEGDLQGADPLPKHIMKAEVRFGRSAKASPSYASSWI